MRRFSHASVAGGLATVLLVACAPSEEPASESIGEELSTPERAVLFEFRAELRDEEMRFVVEDALNAKSRCVLRTVSVPGVPNTVSVATSEIVVGPVGCGLPDAPPFSELGVLCATVTIQSALTTPLGELAAEIEASTPGSGWSAWRAPWVPGQEPPAESLFSSVAYIPYGDLEPGEALSARWLFQRITPSLTFRGSVTAVFAEVPGNGFDDDCDGETDETD